MKRLRSFRVFSYVIAALVLMFSGITSAYAVTPQIAAWQMGGAIVGTVLNIEPGFVSTFAGTASWSADGIGLAARFKMPHKP